MQSIGVLFKNGGQRPPMATFSHRGRREEGPLAQPSYNRARTALFTPDGAGSHRGGVEQGVGDQRGTDHRGQGRHAGTIIAHRDPAAAGGEDQPGSGADKGPQYMTGALRGEGDDKAQSQSSVGGSDDAKIGRADGQHLRVVAEQTQPKHRKNRNRHADPSPDSAADKGADPGDLFGAGELAGADGGADHWQKRGADAEQ